jgi:hypothetical protein
MPDDFITLSSRLLSRVPAIGILLSQQFINDAWHQLQARRDWSWRRKDNQFSPPSIYNTGFASTNKASGQPNLITGNGTAWTPDMIGRQIRLNGMLFPYATIVGWVSSTGLLIDQPWTASEQTNVPYQIVKIYYSLPEDFGYFYNCWSPKDAYSLATNKYTQADLSVLDPQRTSVGQTFAVVFKDFTPQYGGEVGSVIPVGATGPAPVSTTSTGFTYVADATYIVQVASGGTTGIATFRWMRTGQAGFTGPIVTSSDALDLMDGVQIYWPVQTYVANDFFVINCESTVATSSQRVELWPGPTFPDYVYPYIYITQETDLTVNNPKLPPPIAARGEVLLEMALAKCASYPGPDAKPENRNPYFNMQLLTMHQGNVTDMLIDLERNDQEIGLSNITYQEYPMAIGPWMDGSFRQTHAPVLRF